MEETAVGTTAMGTITATATRELIYIHVTMTK